MDFGLPWLRSIYSPLWLCILSLTLSSHAQINSKRLADPIPREVSLMYQKGINYLITNQSSDGTWNDSMGKESAVAACSILAVLAQGEGLTSPKVKTFIKRGLDYIISKQDTESGYIGNSMYNHGFCTLALAECYGIISEPRLSSSLDNAVKLILSAQEGNPKKAWRYNPESLDADTTVTGCQLVALLAAKNAGIGVSDKAIKNGLAYLETCRNKEGAYGYTDNKSGKPTLTAIALLCHFLAKKEPNVETDKTLQYLEKRINYRDQHYPFYFEYYMSQALFQASPESWADWNKKNIRYLKIIQAPDGSWKGNHGKAYSTSAALLSLALNYRFMPIYERF